MSTEKILRQAFIDSFSAEIPCTDHTFSTEFQRKINLIINKKNTPFVTKFKRVASIFLIALIVATTTVFSVSALREPMLQAVKEFFVNAKEFLTGTEADNVAEMFPEKVTKIVGTSFVSETQNQYIIDKAEALEKFLSLISSTDWYEPEEDEFTDNPHTYWSFEFYNGETPLVTMKMCEIDCYSRSLVAIDGNRKARYYYISARAYSDILSFTNKKYYLHNAPYEYAEDTVAEEAKKRALQGLSEGEKIAVAESIRETHYYMEGFLTSNVTRLKESNSIYWDYIISGEEYTDPVTGENAQYTHNQFIIPQLEFLLITFKDAQTLQKLETATRLWKNSMESHNLEGLFKAHEIIHDYDYSAVNYPTKAVYVPYADYQGLDDYFGHLE